MACAHPSKDMYLDNSLDHQEPSEVLHNKTFGNYYMYMKKFTVQHHLESTSTSYIPPGMSQITGPWLENIQYGMLQ